MRLTKKKRIVLSAGGTGGHISPALALHHTLQNRGYETVFITDKRGYHWLPKNEELSIRIVQASAIHAGVFGKFRSAFKIGMGTLKSISILIYRRPNIIVGFGGYPSFPALLAAHLLKIPIILHEQNAVFGRANRVVAPWTKKIALSFPQTLNLTETLQEKSVVTGNPSQQKVHILSDIPYSERKKGDPFKLLIIGGSQGAKIFGEVVHKAIEMLSDELRSNLSIIQQCIQEDIANVEAAYENMGINARVEPFIHDYLDQIAQAHLIISRAGAGSVSLYANLGRPAIYVPLAISLDGDQAQNAQNIVSIGGGWILEEKILSPATLASKLEQLIKTPEQLKNAAKQAKTLRQLDATDKLADLIEPYIK